MIDESVRHEISDFIKSKTGCRYHVVSFLEQDGNICITTNMIPQHVIFILKQTIEIIEKREEETITYKS